VWKLLHELIVSTGHQLHGGMHNVVQELQVADRLDIQTQKFAVGLGTIFLLWPSIGKLT